MTEKNPDLTRKKLLESAFVEIHKVGFQAASLEKILRSAGVTKGALYHHFKGKTELGYAVVDEVIGHWIQENWLGRLHGDGHPLNLLKETFSMMGETARCGDEKNGSGFCAQMAEIGDVSLGCPLMNLAQEMSPVDEGFRVRIQRIFDEWRDAVAGVLERGIREGAIRGDVNPDKTARFLIAMFEGAVGMAKNSKSVAAIQESLEMIVEFLDTLAPAEGRAA
jgi:TetR/AcrR family transcriptional repressor of nem operon